MNHNMLRRLIVMIAGLTIMGLGIAMFKISLMGNDPSTAMVMAVGEKMGIDFSIVLIGANALWFVVEILFGRRYIGIGTFANWFGVGILASGWIDWIYDSFSVPQSFWARMILMLIGVLILSLAASMYQTSNLGIAPYDVLSIILSEKIPVPYFWCRVFTDSLCAILAFLMGGLVGLGTLVCAVGLGPFIAFFNRHVSEKLCEDRPIRVIKFHTNS
ncbi:MAG: hypothetical protein SO016_04975 [Lachnospiraceae bacterium]|nr:hypothetical protein [Robinsoniella sp.]MDY3766035.1 hypothetical protein [Lachnospiraceae bacterium]